MLNSKQRAKLKSIAVNIDALYQMGKNEMDENYVIQISKALEAKEIIKIKVLDNSLYTANEAGQLIAEATDSEVVQTIGSKIVLYRKSRNKEKREVSSLIENIR